MKTNNLKEIKQLKGTLVAKATSSVVSHSSYSFKDKKGVHFIPAGEHVKEMQSLEGPKIGGFNSSRLPDYLNGGRGYSERRKQEIKNKANLTKFTKSLFPFILERYNEFVK